jgi:hypothetical protein
MAVTDGTVDSSVMANMDDVYAMLAALNTRREAALEGARLTAEEFELLRQDVHRELFCGSPVSTLGTEEVRRGCSTGSGGDAGAAGSMQPPTPNASTVHGEAPTAPPSAASLPFDLGHARRSQSPPASAPLNEPMLNALRAAVAESMQVHHAHHHAGHAAPDVDVEALFHAYCADADDDAAVSS